MVDLVLGGDDPALILTAAAERIMAIAGDPDAPVAGLPAGRLSRRLPLPGGGEALVTVGRARPVAAHPPDAHRLVLTVPQPGPAALHDSLAAALERAPFTRAESDAVRSEMPLCTGLAARFPDRPLRSCVTLITAHFLSDLPAMLDAAFALGARPETLVVVDKGYPYRLRHRVAAQLDQTGVRVFGLPEMTAALADQTRRARRHGLRPLIIDDGGHALPALIERLPGELPRHAGLVEQTMSGIYRLEPYEDRLSLPVFSVAQSRLKGTIESYWIADTAVRRVLELLPSRTIEGRPALVVGYGQVGAEIARVLTGLRMRVAVYDRALERLIVAHEAGHATDRDLGALIARHQPLLIFGGTGRTALDAAHLARLPQECYLASVSSGNHEFPLDALAAGATRVVSEGITGTTYHHPAGRRVTVLADGYPVNFHFAESIRNRHSDLTLAALLVGACTLASADHGFTPGHNVARTDEALRRSGLLDHYYALYGPTTGSPA